MPRRYTNEEKRLVLDRLIANHGDVARTAAETRINDRTIHRWRNQYRPTLTTLTTLTTIPTNDSPSDSPRPEGEGQGVRVLSDQLPEEIANRLTALREEMLDAADTLSRSIISAIEEAPLNQRVAALSQLIDRIIKLATQLPAEEEEIEYVYKYKVAHHVEKEDNDEEDREYNGSGDRTGDQSTAASYQSGQSIGE